MSRGNDMPCGECCICDEQLDHSDAGFCNECHRAFCWSNCGGWSRGVHMCQSCQDDKEAEEKDRTDDSPEF